MTLRRRLPINYIPTTSFDAYTYIQELASQQDNADESRHTEPVLNGLRNGEPVSLRQDYFDFD